MTELDEEWETVKAEYESALAARQALTPTEGPTRERIASAAWEIANRRFDRAQRAVVDTRRYWRDIGIYVPDDHPGSRPSHGGFGVATVDNNVEVQP